jgi:hypothetical protein
LSFRETGRERIITVVNPTKAEALRWQGLARQSPILSGENVVDPLRRESTAADFEERSGNDSHHVVEKTAPDDFESNPAGCWPGDGARIDGSSGVVSTVVLLGNPGKVVFADETSACLSHG